MMRAADPTGLGMAAGYAVGRTGCWAVGDDYGRPWKSPPAVAFPDGMPPSTAWNLYRHFGVDVRRGFPQVRCSRCTRRNFTRRRSGS